jgi:hypothetical protein
MLLTAFGCSTHTAPWTMNVSVSLVRGETQFVPGRVTASLSDGTVVASARQSGRPGENRQLHHSQRQDVHVSRLRRRRYALRSIDLVGTENPAGHRRCVDRCRSMLVSVVPGTVGTALVSAALRDV